jgi:hypothetical protein
MPNPWPVAIYLETSVLRALPPEIGTADFLQLKQFCDDMGIAILAPYLCFAELVQARKLQVGEALRRANAAVGTVAQYLDKRPDLNWGASQGAILAAVETTVRRHFDAQGIVLIPTPEIPVQKLLDMAVQKIRPFEEKGEKGFRDTVVLFSLFAQAKKLPPGYHLLLAGDTVFGHGDVAKLALENGVDLRIANSVDAANQHLEQFLDTAAKDLRARRSQELNEFLNQHRPEIEKHVRDNGEFTTAFLFDPLSSIASGKTLERIERVELLDIENAQPGYLPTGVSDGRVEISFDAKVKFTIMLRRSRFIISPKYRVGEEETGSMPPPFLETTAPVEEREITKAVRVEGTAHLAEPNRYSDLSLGRVVGSSYLDAFFPS